MPFKPANQFHSIGCVGVRFSHMIYDLMMSDLFKNVLEIGCYQGYSTWAFLSAMKDGEGFGFTACDVNFLGSVRQMVADLPEELRSSVSLREERSTSVISPKYDFIFVDGFHDIATVGEEIDLLLDCGTDTILAHDTFIRHKDCSGAVLLKKVFSSHVDYLSLNYGTRTNGDQTHYGMSLFTKRKEVVCMAEKLFTDVKLF